MAKMTAQELHNEIAAALGKLSDLFVPGIKLSFMARMPGNGEADVLVGDDNEPDEMIALINRRFSAPSSAPTAGGERQSIDTPEFQELLNSWIAQRSYYSYESSEVKKARGALIAHIDTWAARSAAEAWIDLKEQKPDSGQRVLIALSSGVVVAGYRFDNAGFVGWHWDDTGVDDDAEATATHWRPWPKPIGAAPAPGNTAQPKEHPNVG